MANENGNFKMNVLYRLLQIKLLFNLFQSISRRIQALYFVVFDSFAIKAQAA
jgi:hypothetical protein